MQLRPKKRGDLARAAAKKEPTAAPEMEDWFTGRLLPSLALIGDSGTGKTVQIGRLVEAGFNVCVFTFEQKVAALLPWKDKIKLVNIAKPHEGQPPSWQIKYDRLQAIVHKLCAGGYRETPQGSTVDILAFDGATEISKIIRNYYFGGEGENMIKNAEGKRDGFKTWGRLGDELVAFFDACRDAAGYACAELGLPPVGTVVTALEKPVKDSFPPRFEPKLDGNIGVDNLPSAFEIVWRLSCGDEKFKVGPRKTAEYYAKSPTGVFEGIVEGRGFNTSDGAPDVGKMYRQLLEDEKSVYYQGV